MCSAAMPNTFAKNPIEALSIVRGHFPSTDGSDNFCFYSCDYTDLNSGSYLSCLSLQCEEMFQVWIHSVQLSKR